MQTENAQPAILTTSVAILRILEVICDHLFIISRIQSDLDIPIQLYTRYLLVPMIFEFPDSLIKKKRKYRIFISFHDITYTFVPSKKI